MPPGVNDAAIASLRRRRRRARTLLLVFLALMPVGCVGPLSLFTLVPEGKAQTVLVVAALLLPFVGLGGALLMWGDRSKYTRALALAEQAEQLGLRFTEKPGKEEWEWLRALRTYGHADEHAGARNLLAGTMAGSGVTVMDYTFVIGFGKGRDICDQTVFALDSAAAGVPNFFLGPRGWLDKLARLFGGGGIEIPGEPEFAKRFVLAGDDEEAIRRCLTPTVIQMCLRQPDRTVEVREGSVVVQRYKKLAAPDQYPEVLTELGNLAKVLRGRTTS
jgi:hypothetical protein